MWFKKSCIFPIHRGRFLQNNPPDWILHAARKMVTSDTYYMVQLIKFIVLIKQFNIILTCTQADNSVGYIILVVVYIVLVNAHN